MPVSIVNKYKTDKPYIYIGRGSVFGNPEPIDKTADRVQERNRVCDLYEEHFETAMNDTTSEMHQAVYDLIQRSKAGEHLYLGCFCAPKRCHGDTIKRYIDQQVGQQAHTPDPDAVPAIKPMQTFTGREYLLIDLANQFGLDREEFHTRIDWAESHINQLESLIEQAKEPVLFHKAVKAYQRAANGEAIGHCVGFDSTASGPQLMAAVMRCVDSARYVNLLDPYKRYDLYTEVVNLMNQRLPKNKHISLTDDPLVEGQLTRKQIKKCVMICFYGGKLEIVDILGEETEEANAFYDVLKECLPGVWALREQLIGTWIPYATEHCWDLPDGFQARVKVTDKVAPRLPIPELGKNTKITHTLKFQQGKEFGVANAANVVHSLDALVLREVVRRCNYGLYNLADIRLVLEDYMSQEEINPEQEVPRENGEYFLSLRWVEDILKDPENIREQLTNDEVVRLYHLVIRTLGYSPFDVVTIHDNFLCHPNHLNRLRQTYNQVVAELAQSDTLNRIMGQLTGSTYVDQQQDNDLANYIQQANYSLS